MSRREISIDEFSADISPSEQYSVDINALLGVCGASPVRVRFRTDKIIVNTTYPESILLLSGESYVDIHQIQKIIKNNVSDGKVCYEIVCGILKVLETTVVITKNK